MPEPKKILLTGATGYIGRRLKNRLLQRNDLAIRLLVRNRNKVSVMVRDQLDIVEGDTFHQDALDQALRGIHTAYYLIHSMGADKDFKDLDRKSAENFRNAATRAGVKRIIYLGGLGVRETASKHLLSRIETGEILSAHPEKIQTIWFRAGVIIGSGSASFEIIRHLVQKLPVMVNPKWVSTRTEPISVTDVIAYLEGAADLEHTGNLMIDIGAGVMRFKNMMKQAAMVIGLRRRIFPVPVLSPRLSSYWLMLFTPVPIKVAAALVDGLKSETICQNNEASRYFPSIKPMDYPLAVTQALDEMEHRQVISRWCDSSSDIACDIKEHDDPTGSVLRDVRILPLDGVSPSAVYRAACSIGGETGWYRYNFLWRLRGFIDKLLGGYGLNRGRRLEGDLRIGDALDFWKVADLKENKRVLLLAQMKVPGKAWLEFDIQPEQLVQTAHFLPSGVWGRIYWYSVVPLHNLVFLDLARQIIATAKKMDAKSPASP